jgi:predicted phage tail protein
VGIAVTAHNEVSVANAVVDTLTFTQPAPLTDQPPTVSLTAPANGATYIAPASISLTADASDPEGPVSRVEFYADATLIGTASMAPYSTTWSSVAPGTYSLTAVAFDSAGISTTSSSVSITVSAPNQPPTVILTAPTSGATYTDPATITLTASASDPDGQIARVEFYNGPALLGSASTAPYGFTWSQVPAGTYTLVAIAVDDAGARTTSGSATVTVSAPNQAPTITLTAPVNGATFGELATVSLAAAASDPDGQVARVEFYVGSTLLGTAAAAPYAYTWSGVPAGSYTLTAVAVDDAGARSTSSAVAITVSVVPPPPPPPPTAVVFQASADHDLLVISYTLEIFAADADPNTATPVALADLGKPTPAANGDITSDQSALFSGLAAGNYIATVTAIGVAGSSRSVPVSFTR